MSEQPDPASPRGLAVAFGFTVDIESKSQEAHGTPLRLKARQLAASITRQKLQKEPFSTTARFNGKKQKKTNILALSPPALCFQDNVFKEDLHDCQTTAGLFSLSAPAESD
ncbi:uncharacterized protein V6R79_017766 [Siganus canaliculatus]